MPCLQRCDCCVHAVMSVMLALLLWALTVEVPFADWKIWYVSFMYAILQFGITVRPCMRTWRNCMHGLP